MHRPSVDVIIPVYNEERDLPRCVERLSAFLKDNLPNPWRIVVADNGSTDGTLRVCEELSDEYPRVTYIHLDQKGRGRALKRAWTESEADVVSYMDVDLSTGLEHFPSLVNTIEEGADVAIGSRLMRGSKVQRKMKREITSRGYNMLIKLLFWNTRFHDAQCGFKAVNRRTVRAIVPLVKNNNWFFDTEMLLIAQRHGFKIREVPVRWADDPDTRVKVLKTAWEDVRGLLRLRFGGIPKLREAEQTAQTAPRQNRPGR
jgi:glycosyltransferase involved in cell wall biosynthesis